MTTPNQNITAAELIATADNLAPGDIPDVIPARMLGETTYAKPERGWTCFFCGDTFTTPGSARDHFGGDPLTDPACKIKVGEERGLVMALRRAEKELARYRTEDSDKDREMYAMTARHAQALIREEENGYAKGLRDGRGVALHPGEGSGG